MQPPTFLTSWKEIAQCVGKSVRTVQRWERDMGLPVRRPDATTKGMLIEKSALEHWIRSTFHQDKASSVEMNWEILDQSKQLIANSRSLCRDHSALVQKSQLIRDELEKARITWKNSCHPEL